jgi:hypothetical protein
MHFFFDPDTIDLNRPPRDVAVVTIPGLPRPVVATLTLGQELATLVNKDRAADARKLVEWFGGMDFQGERHAE